jgi:putative DNA primase/helicase
MITHSLDFFPDEIPDELKAREQWVNWRYEIRAPATTETKVPKRPHGYFASHSDPTTWSTWEDVLAGFNAGGFAGVGFVFTEGDPYTGIDFDNVRCPHVGTIDAWAWEWLQRLDSYTEVSPSGAGLQDRRIEGT